MRDKYIRTKPAAACTSIPKDHDGGSGGSCLATGPALPQVGAPGLLAYRVQLELPELGLDGGVLRTPGNGLFHPFRLRQRALLCPHLDGVDKIGERRGFLRQPTP